MENTELGGAGTTETGVGEGAPESRATETRSESSGESVRETIKRTLAEHKANSVQVDQAPAKESHSDVDNSRTTESNDSDDSSESNEPEDTDSFTDKPLPPAYWSKEGKEIFANLPEKAQQEIARRDLEAQRTITRVAQEVKAFKAEYEPFERVLEPYRELYQREGTRPEQIVENAISWDQAFRENKYQAASDFLAAYGVNLNEVAKLQGEVEPAQSQVPSEILETISSLKQELSALKQEREQQKAWEQQQASQQTLGTIEQNLAAFRNAKDANGEPKYPYFQQLESSMEMFILPVMDKYKDLPLSQQLEKAYRLAEADSEEIQIMKRQQQVLKRMDTAESRINGARKASANIRSSGEVSSTQPPKDLRECIKFSMRQAQNGG